MPTANTELHKTAIELLDAIGDLKRHSSRADDGFEPPGIEDYPAWLDAWERFAAAIDQLSDVCGPRALLGAAEPRA